MPAAVNLFSPAAQAEGVGPKINRLLKKLGIETVYDLLTYFPRAYEDRSQLHSIVSLTPGQNATVKGLIQKLQQRRTRTGLTLTQMLISDFTADLELTFFNRPFLKTQYKTGDWVFCYGRLENGFPRRFSSPDIEKVSEEDTLNTNRVVPVYPLTEGLNQKWLRKIIHKNLEKFKNLLSDTFPAELKKELGLMDFPSAVEAMHFPDREGFSPQARKRLAFEELLLFQLWLLDKKLLREKQPRIYSYREGGETVRDFIASLPFRLTAGQNQALKDIYRDLLSPRLMSRMIQGDVGCGKTVVAAFAAFLTALSGHQALVMAPTEILARQHGQKFADLLSPFGIRVGLLTGEPLNKEKKRLLEQLKNGEVRVAVGTHALIQEGVEFQNPALVIIDEQHKFGVNQRTALREKGNAVDLLVMSATPIPRSLALTLYGDLDLSVIEEMPPGRIPIKTYLVDSSYRPRLYGFVRRTAQNGGQAYIVCPAVEESDKHRLHSAVQEAEYLEREIFPDLKVALLHGKMKSSEKERIMAGFRRGEYQVLISTTVIEVGVDVPKANLLIVENSERFGLSQLHQLRGRVGRGGEQAYAVFISDSPARESRERLQVLAESSDGFKVAQRDLELRGPGEFLGEKQHGLSDLRVADLIKDRELLETARQKAKEILESGKFQTPEYQALKQKMEDRFAQKKPEIH